MPSTVTYPRTPGRLASLVFGGPENHFNVTMLLLLSNSASAKMQNSDVQGLEIMQT